MNTSRSLTVISVLAIVAAVATPAQAQQAAGYYNPFDSASDFPSTWYQYGYPFEWSVDSSPIGGISGASFNWNNGTDIDGDYPYGYWYTAEMDMTVYDTPTLSFWCRWDLNSDPYYDYRELYIYETLNYSYIYLPFMIDNDGDGELDLDCGAADQWHQHVIPLTPELASSAQVVFQFYTYSNNYYSGAGYEGWFIDDFSILVPDITPPDAIADLAASNATETEIQLDWTSPNDDDVSGTTASFDLRVSTSAINGTNFDAATQVTGEPAPGANGTPHSALITGLTEDTTYFFALKTTDIAGNVSLISNVAVLATLAPPPPPAPSTSGSGSDEIEVKDDILPCSAGTTAAPTGLMALAGLVALAAIARMIRK